MNAPKLLRALLPEALWSNAMKGYRSGLEEEAQHIFEELIDNFESKVFLIPVCLSCSLNQIYLLIDACLFSNDDE